jgi:putative transposase
MHRRKFASLELVHKSLQRYAERGLSAFSVAVGRYVIMPEHLHLFVRGGSEDFRLANWVKGLKRTTSDEIQAIDKLFHWQPGFFDHVMRSDESYAEKWNYVRNNPVRAGLVPTSAEWPFQGEIVYIDRV